MIYNAQLVHNRFKLFSRDELEMHHMSMVRKNIRGKVQNVSNRANYTNTEGFWEQFEAFEPGKKLVHPHPFFHERFSTVEVVPNYFNVNLL